MANVNKRKDYVTTLALSKTEMLIRRLNLPMELSGSFSMILNISEQGYSIETRNTTDLDYNLDGKTVSSAYEISDYIMNIMRCFNDGESYYTEIKKKITKQGNISIAFKMFVEGYGETTLLKIDFSISPNSFITNVKGRVDTLYLILTKMFASFNYEDPRRSKDIIDIYTMLNSIYSNGIYKGQLKEVQYVYGDPSGLYLNKWVKPSVLEAYKDNILKRVFIKDMSEELANRIVYEVSNFINGYLDKTIPDSSYFLNGRWYNN